MSKRVYKYKIELTGKQQLTLPKSAELLSIQVQNGCIMAWYMVDDGDEEKRIEDILVVGTGHKFDKGNWYYLETVQLDGYVWHIFTEL